MDATTQPDDQADALIAEAERQAGRRLFRPAIGLYEQAVARLAGEVSPRMVRALGGLSWVLVMDQAAAEGLARAEAALSAQRQLGDEPAPVAILEGLAGHALMALGRYAEAQDRYGRALQAQDALGANPGADQGADHWAAGRAETLSLAGEAAFRQKAFGAAADYQQAAIEALRAAGAPGDARMAAALTSLGVSLYRVGRQTEAEAALRQALAIDPNLLLAAENLIHVLYKQGRVNEGRALATEKYRRQSFVVQPPPVGAEGTLLLLWSLDGTVPHRHLLDGLPMGLIDWHIQFAEAAHEARLPHYDLVLNLIGDADEGAAALRAAVGFQARCGTRMLNDPRRIGLTARHDMPRLLGGIDGLVIPGVAQIEAGALREGDARAVLASHGLGLPVLLRSAGRHGGESVQRIDTTAQLTAAVAALEGDGNVYATAYFDTRAADGLYRKYRAIFVDREVFPYHLAISPHWLVHYFSADMLEHDWKREEEMRYLSDMPAVIGAAGMQVLAAIAARMDLDYCGIDFSCLPDGRIVLFECNATMLVHPEAADSVLARKNPYVRRIIDAFQRHIMATLHAGSGVAGDRSSAGG